LVLTKYNIAGGEDVKFLENFSAEKPSKDRILTRFEAFFYPLYLRISRFKSLSTDTNRPSVTGRRPAAAPLPPIAGQPASTNFFGNRPARNVYYLSEA